MKWKKTAAVLSLLLALSISLSACGGAVSYTHLDVYKRQSQDSPFQRSATGCPANYKKKVLLN